MLRKRAATDSLNTKQEIRLDLFQLIVLPGIYVSYERFIDNLSSWRVTAFINFDNEFSEAYRFEYFEVSPYYRLYFKSKNAITLVFSFSHFLA
jgi:hypothetical protein